MSRRNETENRATTPLDRLAEAWLMELVRLDPTLGTKLGWSEHATDFADYSPEGTREVVRTTRAVLSSTQRLVPRDAVDEVTQRELIRELTLILDKHDAGLLGTSLNVIASPPQDIRNAFDLMPMASEEDWRHISQRLRAVPAAVGDYVASLEATTRGERAYVPSRTQALAVAEQAEGSAAFFNGLADRAGARLPEALLEDLRRSGALAAASFERLARDLRTLAPRFRERDAVGRDAYSVFSREFLGMSIDIDETYAWGIEELRRITREMEDAARRIVPGGTVDEAIAALDGDPGRIIHGTHALREWLQATSDAAVEALHGTHVDIPPALQRLVCRIAPTPDGGIYYTPPSEDGERPGQMWWSIPEGVTEFRTWRERTTVYHEGVPGHHLQMGGAVLGDTNLNRWRRLVAGTSGHREGWALYAERLMEEFGFLADPGDRLGMIDAQRMRVARVVLDIGLHTGQRHPEGGAWTAERAAAFMRRNVTMSEPALRFEVLRYLGWPGQASSYSIGQRVWNDLREHAHRSGEPFDLTAFHAQLLALGGLGLDTLRWASRQATGTPPRP